MATAYERAFGMGERIKRTMKEQGASRAWLSRMTGISDKSLAHYVNHDRWMNALTLALIAEALNVDVGWLLLGDDDEQ